MGLQGVAHDWVTELICCFILIRLYISINKNLHAYVHAKVLSHVQLFTTPWTIAHQAPLSIEFSRQEYWGGVAILYSRGPSRPRDQTHISCIFCIGRWFVYHCVT